MALKRRPPANVPEFTADRNIVVNIGGWKNALYHAKGDFCISQTTMKEVIKTIMNNRIMAMLFALVAAMFISIVPVKAEATSPTHCRHNRTDIVAVAKKDPTCDADGNIAHYKCNVCNKLFSNPKGIGLLSAEDVKLPKEHKGLTEIKEQPATHAATGKVAHWYCTDCNKMFTDKTAATQIKAGDEITPVVAHELVWTVTKDGHKQACTGCGYVPVAQAAHDYSGVKAVKVDEQTHSFTCKVDGCGYVLTGNHNDTNKDCICDNCGDTQDHNWSDWGKDGTHHWKSCLTTNCKETTEIGEHDFKVTSNKDGLKHTKTCKTCGYVVEENCIDGDDNDCKCDTCKFVIKHDKSYERMESIYKDPTCTETGLMQHYQCKVCGLLLNINNEVTTLEAVTSDALGHSYNKAISCDDEMHYYRCTRTNCEDKDQSAAHELVYTENGDGTHTGTCKVCGRKPAKAQNLKHNYGKGEVVDGKVHKITCADCGYATRQACADNTGDDCLCDNCGGMIHHLTAMLETVSRKEPTCTEKGNIGYHQCKTCQKIFSGSSATGYTVYTESVEIAELGHEGNGVWEKTEDGKHYQWCHRDCGTKVKEAAHTDSEWIKDDGTYHKKRCPDCNLISAVGKHEYEATESTDGQTHKLTCKDCGYATRQTCVDSDVDADCDCDVCGGIMPHVRGVLDYIARHNPTCTEDGNVGYFTCKTCGLNFEQVSGAFVVYEKDVTLKALDHDWEEGTETDSTTGNHIESCEREGCKAVRSLAHTDKTGDCKCDINNCGKLIHSHKLVFNNPVAATCDTDGSEAYYTYLECDKAMFAAVKSGNGYTSGAQISAIPVIKALGCDEGGDWVAAENGKHVKKCTRCGDVVKTESHNFENGPVCAVCGMDETLKHKAAVAPNCTKAGNVEYWYSDISGKVFLDAFGKSETTWGEVELKALGHLETGWYEDGNRNHKQSCQREGCDWSQTERHTTGQNCRCTVCGGAVSGHTMTLKKMQAPTCTKDGYEAYYQCSCRKLYNMDYEAINAPVVIEKLGHNFENAKVQKDVKEGKHYVECNACDYKLYEEHAMKMSDPMKGNYHQWLCSCGELEIETHYDENGDNKCDVCDHRMSGTQETTSVEQHDNKTVYTGESSTVQSNKNWLQNWLESLTPSNAGGSTATEKAPQSNASTASKPASENQPAAQSKPATAPSGSTNTAPSDNTAPSAPSVNPAPSAPSSTTTAPSAPSAAQTSVITQFITWFLGLFGF